MYDDPIRQLFEALFPQGFAGADVRRDLAAQAQTDREVGELVTLCLWDVFSNNHTVLASDGREIDLGSFRGSADYLADLLNEQVGERRYGYADFYLGTMMSDRSDVEPVYRLIFRRMHASGLDWRYSFPRLHVVELAPAQDEWQDYDPSRRIAEQAERDRLRAELDASHREAVSRARRGPPPALVESYHRVYGRLPSGWPPEA